MYTMQAYDDALRLILNKGVWRSNKRTGIRCLSYPGILSRYRIDENFPVLTRRKVWPKSIFAELLWFISGSTCNKDLQALGANIWTPWVDSAFEEKHGYAEGCFGPVYGFQLRHFGGTYGNGVGGEAYTKNTTVKVMMECNSGGSVWEEEKDFGSEYGRGGFDQLAWIMNRIKEDPSCRRILFSLWNPKDVSGMKLPPCFVGTTPILSNTGYKNIEEINNGDYVFADGTWEKVYDKQITPYSGECVRLTLSCLSGEPISCTPNHPFWIKNKGWTHAADIKVDDYCLFQISNKSIEPVFKAKFVGGEHRLPKDYKLTPNDWWLIGYYLGDGWTNKDRISFAVANSEKDQILPKIRMSLKVCKKPDNKIRNCYTYETKSKKWAVILKELGNKSHLKKIPSWILDAPIDCLMNMINGYFDSDGCNANANYYSFNTVSRNLALGMQQVFWKAGIRASINYHPRPSTCVIEGRTVNQRGFYSIVSKKPGTKIHNHKNFVFDKDGVWLRVKKKDIILINEKVYNISVDNKHVYSCAGIKTHNCHYTYQVFIDDDGRLSGMMTQRSCDFPIGVPANIQFYSALTKMIAQQTGYQAYEFVHSTVDSHIYENQLDAIHEYLATPIIDSPKLNINKAKDIFSYKMEDFELTDYNPGPAIKIPVAV